LNEIENQSGESFNCSENENTFREEDETKNKLDYFNGKILKRVKRQSTSKVF
jgi:hypothetical protein